MGQSKENYDAKLRQWELMLAYRSLDTEQQKQVLRFVLELEAGMAVSTAD